MTLRDVFLIEIMKFKVGLILLYFSVLFNTNGFSQSWKPKPVAQYRLAEGGYGSCGVMVLFIDSSKIINPCNIIGDSCDTIIDWTWKFGNGKTSKLKNPICDYRNPMLETGAVNVTLVIKTKFGFKDSLSHLVLISDQDTKFRVFKNDTIIEVGDSINFENRSTSMAGSTSKWEWSFGNGTSLIDSSNNKAGCRYTKAGKYEVYLTWVLDFTKDGFKTKCIDTYPDTNLGEKKIIITVNEAVGILNHNPTKLYIFPNPAKDYITIKGVEKGEIVIYDLCGKGIFKEELNPNEHIDISTLIKGIYFVKFTKTGMNYIGRFIKN